MGLDELFTSLRNEKKQYLNAKKGKDFEEHILAHLKQKMGFTVILKSDIDPESWAKIQTHVRDKLGTSFLDLPQENLKRTIMFQPFGSQDFPDILVFTDKKVVPVEVKFSSQAQSKPIWNSNIPLANAFYIFGSYGLQDLTFFCGNDVLSPEQREALYGFFANTLKKIEAAERLKMPAMDKTDRGFTPYIRMAFDQSKYKPTVQTSFFAHPDRKLVEDRAIELAATL